MRRPTLDFLEVRLVKVRWVPEGPLGNNGDVSDQHQVDGEGSLMVPASSQSFAKWSMTCGAPKQYPDHCPVSSDGFHQLSACSPAQTYFVLLWPNVHFERKVNVYNSQCLP